jgi:hypothetical protein
MCGIDCFACQFEFFVNNPDVKENDEHALDFALHLSRLFGLGEFPRTAPAFFSGLSNHCQGLRRTFPRFAKSLTLFLCQFHREIALGQMHDSK